MHTCSPFINTRSYGVGGQRCVTSLVKSSPFLDGVSEEMNYDSWYSQCSMSVAQLLSHLERHRHTCGADILATIFE